MIERGETWILDTDMRVYTLTVEGTLIWDTTKDDLKISAKYVLGKTTYHLKPISLSEFSSDSL